MHTHVFYNLSIPFSHEVPSHAYFSLKPFVDTQDAESSLWLVKVPEYIARRWVDKKPNEMLGRMNITLVPDKMGNGNIMSTKFQFLEP